MFVQVQSPGSGEATGTVLLPMIAACVTLFSNHMPVFPGDNSNLSVPALTRKLPLNDESGGPEKKVKEKLPSEGVTRCFLRKPLLKRRTRMAAGVR